MLKGDFYHIITNDHPPGKINAIIRFDHEHPIFQGHFPGNPVVPGVCMIQIVREFIEGIAPSRLKITSSSSIKFLSVINPLEAVPVSLAADYSIQKNVYTVQASLFSEQIIYFKFKGILEHI